jgi:hypothetical protein
LRKLEARLKELNIGSSRITDSTTGKTFAVCIAEKFAKARPELANEFEGRWLDW